MFNEAWSNFFCLRFLNVFFYIIIILKLKKRHRPHRLFSGCFAIMVLEGERGHHITKYLISTVFERGGVAIGLIIRSTLFGLFTSILHMKDSFRTKMSKVQTCGILLRFAFTLSQLKYLSSFT